MISILYADNDNHRREMMDDFFSNYPGLELIRFSSGKILLDYIQTIQDDLVAYLILDMDMCDLNVVDILKQLRSYSNTAQAKALLLSHYITEKELEVARAFDALLLEKPITQEMINEVGTPIVEYCYSCIVD